MTDRLVTGGGGATGAGTVRVEGGRIVGVEAGRRGGDGVVIDVGGLVVMPGVIDAHVHVNEPGRTEWEGFASAGRAAAAGGVTTMVVMPLNCSPVATTREALLAEARAAAGACAVDFGFWGGVVPGNAGELAALWDAGVLGFKCFLVHSGIDEFPNSTRADLEKALGVLRGLKEGGAVLLAHAEAPEVIDAARAGSGLDARPRSYGAYLASRPAGAEVRAIEMMVGLCRESGSRVHIVHVATGEALPLLRAARGEGLAISAETCPHYLAFAAEEIGEGRTEFKCAPPIRGKAERERLWEGLKSGDLDLIGSDHSPCPAELKELASGSFAAAWGGISSLQLTLALVWSGARGRGFALDDVARWLCVGPSRLAGVDGFKGKIAPGYDADLVVFDPEASWIVRGAELEHRHKVTPYDGVELRGRVMATFVRGRMVYAAGDMPGASGQGWGLGADGFRREASGTWVKRAHT